MTQWGAIAFWSPAFYTAVAAQTASIAALLHQARHRHAEIALFFAVHCKNAAEPRHSNGAHIAIHPTMRWKVRCFVATAAAMTIAVFLAVLLAALLHAAWNAMVKSGNDKYLATASVVIGQGIFAIPTLFFVPSPDPASYPFIVAGIGLHLGYQFFLMASYRTGDLTQVYPLARGNAPLIVALISVVFLGEVLTFVQMCAIATIGLGIMSIAFVRKAEGRYDRQAAVLALVTGCFIASYSLVDGMGARLAGTAIGFYGWLTIGNALVFGAISGVTRPGLLRRVPAEGLSLLFVGGAASYAAYALVIWSFTQAPIALVTALRETSIVFALLIGVLVLRERLDLAKVFATLMTLAGMVMLRMWRTS